MSIKFPLFFVVLLLVFSSFGQDSLSVNKYEPSGEFSVILRNNFGKGKVENTFGPNDFKLMSGITHSMRFGYQFNLPHNFGITLRAAFGLSPMVFWDDFYDSVVWPTKPRNYTDNVSYNLFGALEAGASYTYQLNSKYELITTGGFGVNFSNSFTRSFGIGNGNNDLLLVETRYNNNPKPFLFYELGIAKTLKNKNKLNLSFALEHSLDPLYRGVASRYESNLLVSQHNFKNLGTNFGFNLGYTFTRNKRKETAKNNSLLNNTSLKLEKKKTRQNMRFLHPKSIVLGVQSGLFFTKNKIKGSDSPFISGYYSWWNLAGFAQVGIQKDYFYEVGFGFEEYAVGKRFKNPDFFGGYSNLYVASKFYGGIGKRIIHKPSNIKLINVQAGIGMILTYNTNNTSAGSSGGGSFNGNDSLVFSAVHDYKLLVAPTLYILLEKDFQLSPSLFASVRYRYDQGIFPMFKEDITYIQNGVSGTVQNLIFGTSQTFGFALKYKFLQKKYRDE